MNPEPPIPTSRALPDQLKRAIDKYLDKNPSLLDPLFTFDSCFDVSADFVGFLAEERVIFERGRGKKWDVVKVWEFGENHIPVDMQLYRCHWIFRYGLFAIDWTVKQFYPHCEVTVPLIWRLDWDDFDPGDSVRL